MELNKDNFEKEVLQETNLPVLVDFWAPWCGPCRSQTPIIEQLAKETEGKLKVAKLNVDEAGEIAKSYGVMSIPTLIVFKDGKPASKAVGLQNIQALKNLAGI
ncbi:Thioredoxin [Holotrichia oblita]|nr:Thioredoxin [Holotrichia oblita]